MSCSTGLFFSSTISAQGSSAGDRDANGRVMTKLAVTMSEPGAYGRPASDLAFLVVTEDGDRFSMRTNEAGVASMWLAPGSYRFVTPDPLKWEGYAYTWDRVIPIRAAMAVIQLTQNEARSIALAADGHVNGTRTSEPYSLSSKPAPWKPVTAPTEDLRPSLASTRNQGSSLQPSTARSHSVSETAPAHRQLREGFWFNIGTGYGAISCETCVGSVGGYSGGISFGGTLSPRFLLGVGTTSWLRSESGVSLLAGTVDARLRFYPTTTSGFFVTGGLGVGTIGADLAEYGSATEIGGGAVLGLGWDLRVAKGISLTPFWNAFAVATSSADANVGQIGIGLTLH